MLAVNPVKTIARDRKSGKILTLYSDNLVRSLENNVLSNHGDWNSFAQKWDAGIYKSFELSSGVSTQNGRLTLS